MSQTSCYKEGYMSLSQVAHKYQLATLCVYNLAEKGDIPAYQFEELWFFKEDEVDQWYLNWTGKDLINK